MTLSKKLRVAHVITKLELGGAQQNTLYTVTHLDRTRFEVYLAFGPGGILTEQARNIPNLYIHEVKHLIRPIRPHRDFLAFVELYRWFRSIRPHIVHTHSSKAGILGRLAAAIAGVPIIIHSIHGWGITPEQPSWLRYLLIRAERLVGRYTHHFIAVSRENLKWGIRNRILSPDKCRVIRSGIKLEHFRQPANDAAVLALKQRYNLTGASHIIGMIACFKPQKAPLDFIRLARRLHRRFPKACFVLIGDGELRPKIERYIQRYRLEPVVRLPGWQTDVRPWYALFDVFVLTSLWEGLPRVIPEALSSGVPVVATAVDGTKEIIRHRKTGFLVRPHDIRNMERYVAWTLKHPEKARRMVQRAGRDLEEFDIDLMVRQQETLYEKLANELLMKTSKPLS